MFLEETTTNVKRCNAHAVNSEKVFITQIREKMFKKFKNIGSSAKSISTYFC